MATKTVKELYNEAYRHIRKFGHTNTIKELSRDCRWHGIPAHIGWFAYKSWENSDCASRINLNKAKHRGSSGHVH